MLRHKETLIGAAALIVLALLLGLSAANRKVAANGSADGYTLSAVFNRTDGLRPGAPVRVAGIHVGRVMSQELDDMYRAQVTLRVAPGVAIPADSAAIIETDGLLGEKYLEIQPGGMEEMLEPGSRIEYTQDSVVIEDLLARIVSQAKAKRDAVPQPGAADGTEDASPIPPLFGPIEPEGEDTPDPLPEGQQKTLAPAGPEPMIVLKN